MPISASETSNTLLTWLKLLGAAPAKWQRRTGPERMLLLEAFFLLGVARLLILTIPFRWLATSLGKHMAESGIMVDTADLQHARLIGHGVCSAASNTPWESVCLPQAVAGLWMLKRRRIPATLYLGVAKTEQKQEQLAAHAWLRCGEVILTGAKGHRQFTVVSTFS